MTERTRETINPITLLRALNRKAVRIGEVITGNDQMAERELQRRMKQADITFAESECESLCAKIDDLENQ